MRKKPGGQPNNKNAYKHGFYSRYFSPFESRTLSEIPITDMSGEIGLVRVNVERFMESYAASLDHLDYASRLAGLRAITLAVGRIAALQRILSIPAKNLAEFERISKLLDGLPYEESDDLPFEEVLVDDPPPEAYPAPDVLPVTGDHDPEG